MSVSLTNPISRGVSANWRVTFIGANYDNAEVIIRITFDSGDTRDYRFAAQGGFATLNALLTAVDNFRGLRNGLESYLAGADPTLAGTVS